MQPNWVVANNPGPFTLDGTRTFFVGRRRVAVIDPGPLNDLAHIEALVEFIGAADEVTILLTHGHEDHAGGVEALVDRTGAAVRGVGHDLAGVLADGDVVDTDVGALIAVETPGHANPHLVFHWPAAGAAFMGDLILGRGDTTWIGEYGGCVADYFGSLDRVEALGCRVLYPAHGPPVSDVPECLERFRAHRLERIEEVRAVLSSDPGVGSDSAVDSGSAVDLDRLYDVVYAEGVPGEYRWAAEMSLEALMDYVRDNPA